MTGRVDNKRSGYRILITIVLLVLALVTIKIIQSYSKPDLKEPSPKTSKQSAPESIPTQDKDIPEEALHTYKYALENNGSARPGYKGNTVFGNRERILPQRKGNTRLTYKEYDIYPYRKGKNRGPHRVVISSDDTGYYTSDHYKSFKQLPR